MKMKAFCKNLADQRKLDACLITAYRPYLWPVWGEGAPHGAVQEDAAGLVVGETDDLAVVWISRWQRHAIPCPDHASRYAR